MQESTPDINLSLQVVPINTTDAYPIIDKAIHVIQGSGVKYEVNAFSTVMEGQLDRLLEIVLQAKDAAFKAGAEELVLNVQLHLKKDKAVSLEEKTVNFRS